MRKQQGKEDVQLAVLVKNDYFGEMGLVARRRRSGTVTATSDTTLLLLSRDSFENLFRKTPQMRLNMDVAIRSRKLARSLRFNWLRSDEVIYFLARKHQIILYEKLVVPLLALLVPSRQAKQGVRTWTHRLQAIVHRTIQTTTRIKN